MQISMEVLSQIIPRADSGASTRQKSQPFSSKQPEFSKIFDEKRTVYYPPILTEARPGEITIEDEPIRDTRQKPKKDEMPGTCLAIGVTGNQNMVVFILEGDKESAAIPEISIDADVAADELFPVTEGTDIESEVTEPAPADVKAEPFTTDSPNTETVKIAAETGAMPSPPVNTDNTVKAETVKNDTAGSIEGATGEATARTPIIGTSEQKETGGYQQENPGNSGSGDLSPLENENDATPVKGQKVKTYSETEQTVRNKAEGSSELVSHAAIPLAEGIKPERFQADQQMKQVASNLPVRKENLFDEMVSRIEMMQTESKSGMSIQLKPEFLGKVALDIAIDATGLHVKINAEDSGVRNMLGGQMAALIESLENKGIAVVEVEVTYTGVNNGAFKDSREDQAQQNRPRRTIREIGSVDLTEIVAALPLDMLENYLEEEVSSVEYRA